MARILVIDDQFESSESGKKRFAEFGRECLPAHNAEAFYFDPSKDMRPQVTQAVSQAMYGKYDLVVLDVYFGEGFSSANRLGIDVALPLLLEQNLPVVVFSALTDQAEILRNLHEIESKTGLVKYLSATEARSLDRFVAAMLSTIRSWQQPERLTLTVLLYLLGRANPVFFLTRGGQPGLKKNRVARILSPPGGAPLFAAPDLVREAWREHEYARLNLPDPTGRVNLPRHVFAVHEQNDGAGFVVPMECRSTKEWWISQDFHTFGPFPENRVGMRGSQDCLEDLLALIAENVSEFGGRHRGMTLSLSLACPIDLHLLTQSRSMELPLVLTLLRELYWRNGAFCRDPFGDGPVFSTGTVERNGSFGPVENVKEKLEAFLRELGTGHPAVLTSTQKSEAEQEYSGLLGQVQVRIADNIAAVAAFT